MLVLRVISGLAALCLAAWARPAAAGELPGLAPFFARLGLLEGRGDFSNGFDVTGNGWSAYGSAVIALTGPADQDGWRIRLSGNYGAYGYDTRQTYCQLSAEEKKQLNGTNFSSLCNDISNDPPQGAARERIAGILAPHGMELIGDQIIAATPHRVTHYNVGVAPGYQATLGALILKVYLGAAFEQQDVLPDDASKSLQGGFWGAQSGLEAWLPLGDDLWLSADGSYFTGTSAYGAAVKLGFRPLSWLSLGPQLAAFGDADDVSGRAGAFLRFDAMGLETTLAAGLSGGYRDETSTFGSVNIYRRF
ncbi:MULTISPECIES: cellulose biosynthesis protein BcsS [Rhodomicrobium]|uniref:cellulose biosynthesis protein BcsS n=1 Tax=Rhodomicrobium TaxID=1068 RepID=UPI000B4BE9B0|nr:MULTISPECIES: cellulose biosynthesis protein BcsS [Rhodomicrobium]